MEEYNQFLQQEHASLNQVNESNDMSNANAIYVNNVGQEQPVKIRKKPGRKPNPASPALRKAQNRAAQRAFRERKERHLKDLEGTIRQLKDQRNTAIKELNQTKKKLDSFRAENWYLKGVVLTLQFVCLHHNIHIPTHSPYLTEEDLSEMAKTTPHAIESYVNAYTKNNINLKPTMVSHFSNQDSASSSPLSQHKEEEEDEEDEAMEDIVKHEPKEEEEKSIKEEEEEEDSSEIIQQQSSISAIQTIRLQLRVHSTISHIGNSAARLQPTILQLAIPHDPRIDLVPTPHMRDRMIIFRDQMDYDHCFNMLLNGAVYHGGDPTMSASWELPAEFFAEYWYLAINYDLSRTNTWRKLKGLPEINVKDIKNNVKEHNDYDLWTDKVLSQLTEDMPSLQPIDSGHLSSGFDFGSPPSTLFDGYLLHRPLHQEDPIFGQTPPTMDRSASIDTTIMGLMNSLSTDLS